MSDQQLGWGNTDSTDFFSKALCNQEGPYVTTIAEFTEKPDFKADPAAEDVMVLHVRFNIQTNTGWAKMTIPMKNALIKMYPDKQPNELINAPVMILAQIAEAKGSFSAGYQLVLSNAPQQQPAPQPTQPAPQPTQPAPQQPAQQQPALQQPAQPVLTEQEIPF